VNRDRGGMTILMLGLCALLTLLALTVSSVGVLLSERERAAAAAEAAALAAAVATYPPAAGGSPSQAAAEMADANGARVISCVCSVDESLRARTVIVTVSLMAEVPVFGGVVIGRTARAEFDPGQWLGW
jgi:secretion/DNA translocation related TadE-like protein